MPDVTEHIEAALRLYRLGRKQAAMYHISMALKNGEGVGRLAWLFTLRESIKQELGNPAFTGIICPVEETLEYLLSEEEPVWPGLEN